MYWPIIAPLAGLLTLLIGRLLPPGPLIGSIAVAVLFAAVIAAVHHAEVVAHRVGEPFGTLVLAMAITVIEVALILSLMLAGGAEKATLPRDTLYAAVMIISTGVVGLCVWVGGIRHSEQTFRVEGATSGLAALVALCGLVLVLPVFTTSSPQGTYTRAQLLFVALASLALWGVYVFIQTVRHRDYFLPLQHKDDESTHAAPPSNFQAWISFVFLLLSLVAVVGLAKALSPGIESLVVRLQVPKAVVGIVVAMLVLAPETWAAVRAARANRLQTSLNLAIGSALASIGLTVPVVVAAVVLLDLPLVLGLEAKDMVLLGVTFLVGAITLASGRTNVMQGAIHLVLFAAFLFLSVVP
jgi:Ca2+:H+ antiporter